jgi:hypothetical protein
MFIVCDVCQFSCWMKFEHYYGLNKTVTKYQLKEPIESLIDECLKRFHKRVVKHDIVQ